MRIAFLTFEYPDVRPGGVGAYVLKCARALAAIGHEPHLFTLQIPGSIRRRLPPGVHVHEVLDVAHRVEAGQLPPALAAAALAGTQSTYKLLVGTMLCDALRSEHQALPFDIVEAAECEGLALPLLLRPLPNLPVVVQIHLGLAANAVGNGITEADRDHVGEAVELASIVGADAVCAATQSVVDVTRTVSPFSRDVMLIPYPVEPNLKDEMPPPPANGGALFIGRLHRRKGCDVLAAAADLFLRRNPLATLRIAGSDTRLGAEAESMLAQMIARIDAPVRDRFIYLGELSQSQVRAEIHACLFQITPSVIENFANTAVDAMAMGRLVIYGGNTGLDEVVADAGIRVWPLTAENLADQMERAFRNPKLAQEYGQRAVERVRARFDAQVISRRRIAFFEQVIADHQSGRIDRDRQWQALTGRQIAAVLSAMVSQMSAAAGLDPADSTPGLLLTARLRELQNRLGRPPGVWLFGAGRFTLRLLGERHRWESLGLALAGIIDDHPRFEQSPSYLGLPVAKPAKLCAAVQAGLKIDAIILSTDTLEDLFRERTECFAKIGIQIVTLSSGQ
jgi:glycosyltransferase involved in cell wall biosynthesis